MNPQDQDQNQNQTPDTTPNSEPAFSPTPNFDEQPQQPAPQAPVTAVEPAPAPFGSQPAQPEQPSQQWQPEASTPQQFDQQAPQQGAPEQPTSPDVFGAPLAPQPPQKKSKKGLIIGLVIGLLVLLAGAAAAYYFLLYVSKADYQAASTQMSAVRESIPDATELSSVGMSDSPTVADMQESLKTFKEQNEKLATYKAMKYDPELKEKHDAYAAKAQEFIAFMDIAIPSGEKILEASEAFNSMGTELSSANMQSAIEKLKELQGVPEPIINEYLKKTLAAYEEALPHVKEYEEASSTADKMAALNKVSTITSTLFAAALEFSKEFSDKTEAVSPEKEFNALVEAVNAKTNG